MMNMLQEWGIPKGIIPSNTPCPPSFLPSYRHHFSSQRKFTLSTKVMIALHSPSVPTHTYRWGEPPGGGSVWEEECMRVCKQTRMNEFRMCIGLFFFCSVRVGWNFHSKHPTNQPHEATQNVDHSVGFTSQNSQSKNPSFNFRAQT